MKKKLIFSLLVLAGVPSLSMAVDEARLLRFPATNGNEIVFSYAPVLQVLVLIQVLPVVRMIQADRLGNIIFP